MKKIITIFVLFIIMTPSKVFSQCIFNVDNNEFNYSVDVNLNVTDIIYTQQGSTCNVEIEVFYDIQIDVDTQPGWWNENLYVLQGTFNCAGSSGTSFFDLPNGGGSGTTTSATFSFSNIDCADATLDCPITVQLQGPALNDSGSCGIYSAAALPVSLKYFSYLKSDNELIDIKWATASETNFSHFELESSKDFNNWILVDRISGKNDSFGSEYSIPFASASASANQEQYLRLKIIDLDGTFEYSDNIIVPIRSSSNFNLYPNPASDQLFLSGIRTDQIIIFNNLGEQITLPILSEYSLDVSSLERGSYTIKSNESIGLKPQRFIKI